MKIDEFLVEFKKRLNSNEELFIEIAKMNNIEDISFYEWTELLLSQVAIINPLVTRIAKMIRKRILEEHWIWTRKY